MCFIKLALSRYRVNKDAKFILNRVVTCNIISRKLHLNNAEPQNNVYLNRTTYHQNRRIYTLLCFVAGWGTYFYFSGKKIYLSNKQKKSDQSYQLYTLEEVRKHDSKEDRIWVTYKEGVYDITDFVDNHPGGEIIMMAAGNAIDPFWSLYGVHKQPEILNILETYRIGSLSREDSQAQVADLSDPYANEPKRNFPFIVNSEKPFNAEPQLPLLVKNFITPSEIFYVRNHLPVPLIDTEEYELEITGLGVNETKLTLHDLQTKFPKVSVVATVQCAGNRRSEMTKIKPVKGLNWSAGAIGNAVWSGARLHDVLKFCGFKDILNIRHIQFEGLDTDPTNVPYGASIPIEKLLNAHSDVILAYEMNGEPLSRDHGFPIRVIVPGVVGARNVKWLGRIILAEDESPSHWQQNDYKGFNPTVDWDTVDFKSSNAIQELPVTSAICEPTNDQLVKLKEGKLMIRGYAWSGGGAKVYRIDVTIDKGKTWHTAEIVDSDPANPGRNWSWVLWKTELMIDKNSNEVEIWAKAVDSNYNVQPESFEHIWNLRGVLGNAYHRIKVKVTD